MLRCNCLPEQGFAKTSIREIALAAQANVASISYYFGDKAGLYRAVFSDPRTNPPLPPKHWRAPMCRWSRRSAVCWPAFWNRSSRAMSPSSST